MTAVEKKAPHKPTKTPPDPWWGSFVMDVDRAGRWRVGPTTLWIERHDYEWRVTRWQEGDPLDENTRIDVPASMVKAEIPPKDSGIVVTTERYSYEKTTPNIEVTPALADRPIVVRPEESLYVPAGETVTMFVSTPLWVRVEAGEDHDLLTEIPSYRPSDSWFGPNTREGELCYSTSTLARLNLRDVPLRLHRAVTPIVVRNPLGEVLNVERIRVPVGYLSLYRGVNGFLWTESIEFDRVENEELASMSVGRGAPRQAKDAQRIVGPRQTHDRSVLVRTFSSIIHRIIDA